MSQQIAVIPAETIAPLDPLDAFEWFLQIGWHETFLRQIGTNQNQKGCLKNRA